MNDNYKKIEDTEAEARHLADEFCDWMYDGERFIDDEFLDDEKYSEHIKLYPDAAFEANTNVGVKDWAAEAGYDLSAWLVERISEMAKRSIPSTWYAVIHDHRWDDWTDGGYFIKAVARKADKCRKAGEVVYIAVVYRYHHCDDGFFKYNPGRNKWERKIDIGGGNFTEYINY